MEHLINECLAFRLAHALPIATALFGGGAGALLRVTCADGPARPCRRQKRPQQLRLFFRRELPHEIQHLIFFKLNGDHNTDNLAQHTLQTSGNPPGQFLGRPVEINVLLEPVKGDFHLASLS